MELDQKNYDVFIGIRIKDEKENEEKEGKRKG